MLRLGDRPNPDGNTHPGPWLFAARDESVGASYGRRDGQV